MKNNIITQSEAARIAGVSKQAIGGIKEKGTYNFFYETTTKSGKIKYMVDIDHPHWESYLLERNNGKSKNIEKKEISKKHKKEKKIKTNPKNKLKKEKKNISDEQKIHSLTGGVDPSTCDLRTTADVKRLTEITKMNLEMRIKLGEYIKREIMDYYLDLISHNIASVFVNLGRSVSEDICTELERIGFERKVEEIISKPVAKGIESIQKACEDGKKLRVLK